MPDFHRASLELAMLRLCRITNESTETKNCYQSLNRELRWLWNSVYICKSNRMTDLSQLSGLHGKCLFEDNYCKLPLCCSISLNLPVKSRL